MINKRIKPSTLVLIITFFVAIVLLLAPGFMPQPSVSKAAGLSIITIALFATGRIPEYLTALLFFLVAMLFNIVPAEVVFSGFQSTAFWLVFGGLVMGVAITVTGLGERIAGHLASHFEGSYTKLIAGMVMACIAFAFIMPSAMGRIMLLIPITLALADHFGFTAGTNGRVGLVLATTLGSFIPAFSILPANVPNLVFAGMAESQYGVTQLFGEYLWLHFPILGFLKALLIIAIIIRLYPDNPQVDSGNTIEKSPPMTKDEKILAVMLGTLLLLWLTDFIHHISPAWIAMGGAIVLLHPWVGIVSTKLFNSKVNYGSLFFVAGVIGLGGLINHSGLGSLVGGSLIAFLPLGTETPFINFISITTATTLTGILTTLPGVPAVITPLAAEISQVTNMPIQSVLMMQVVGFSTMIFPYQAPPVIVAMQLSGEKLQHTLKPVMLVACTSFIILIPLDYLWWHITGWI